MAASRKLAPELLEKLSKFASCDIGDALVKMKVPHGGYLSGLRAFSPSYLSGQFKMCGPAHTIKMVGADDKAAPSPKVHFADSITKNSVVFVSQPKGLISACWGGLMSTRAKKLGAAGVIIDGRFRDINEHRELGMNLFARDMSILGSNSFTRASEIDVPISYAISEIEGAEVKITPGDIILGDVDGVVAVPVEAVEECIKLCQERYDIDEETRTCLENGDELGPTIKRLRK
ncbi:RraA-like protein [Rhizodiscina lignyota]|uniref:RraA-like protein n=1 Tax=Rhizodiscina lignyota TaxID=1504668 RepID=A0A9P4M395_9PEZI|nr:RraA-like protein [Rhizodiscina lignyota]